MDLIQQIGAVVGLAAFIGLAVLALLYFSQARDVRDLREKATFIPEGYEPAAVPPPAEAGEVAEGDDERAREIAVARQAEIARAAAERRLRFQRRRQDYRRAGEGLLARLPEGRQLAIIGVGVVLLVAGVVFGATRLLGGEEETGGGGQQTAAQGPSPGQIEVAVLNGTAVAGLASQVGQQVREDGFQLGPITNTETPVDTTTVMFDQGAQEQAQAVAAELQVGTVEPMSAEIQGIAEGAPVAVVVGEDRAGGAA